MARAAGAARLRNGCLDMVQIIGLILILLLITGGLALSGGPAILSALPFELSLILGAGIAGDGGGGGALMA